jgi:hypothetical protein
MTAYDFMCAAYSHVGATYHWQAQLDHAMHAVDAAAATNGSCCLQ